MDGSTKRNKLLPTSNEVSSAKDDCRRWIRAGDAHSHAHAYTVARNLERDRARTSAAFVLGFVLMLTQAFFYNAIFFTYGLVLMRFYDVPANNVGGYLLPFALGNVLGPLLLGHLFDTIGRKQMITATYIISGVLLALTGWLFYAGVLTAQTQTLAWSVDLLRRVGRCQFRLSDRERNFPAGNSRFCHRDLLRHRDAGRRRRRAAFVWLDHWDRFEHGVVHRLSGRRGADDSLVGIFDGMAWTCGRTTSP